MGSLREKGLVSEFQLLVESISSDNDNVRNLRPYTINFEQCRSNCSMGGYSYACYNTADSWDYCSMEHG